MANNISNFERTRRGISFYPLVLPLLYYSMTSHDMEEPDYQFDNSKFQLPTPPTNNCLLNPSVRSCDCGLPYAIFVRQYSMTYVLVALAVGLDMLQYFSIVSPLN